MTTKVRASKSSSEGEGRGGKGQNAASGWIVFITGALVTAFLFWTNPLWPNRDTYNLVNTGCCLWIPLLVILFALQQDPNQFGLARGDRRLGLKWALALWIGMLPFLFYAAHQPAFVSQYLFGRLSQWQPSNGPVFDGKHMHPSALLYYELTMGFYMFCWEFFFRGFLLFGLQRTRLGIWGAILLQTLPFGLLHWSWMHGASKPWSEVAGSLIAAPILGILAWKTRSCIYGFLAHWAVSVTLDLLLLAPYFVR